MELRIKERISYIAKHPGHKKLRPNNIMLQKVENMLQKVENLYEVSLTMHPTMLKCHYIIILIASYDNHIQHNI